MAATGTVAYRIVVKAEVDAIDAAGHYVGSALDERDGYLHMSTAETVRDTAQKYYAGRDDVVLLTIDLALPEIKDHIKWEAVASRGGALFPHLYDVKLPVAAIKARTPLVWSEKEFTNYPDAI